MTAALKLRQSLPLFLLLVAATILFTAPGAVSAQRGSEFTSAAAALPPASRAVVERLAALTELPAGVWKIHSGDLAHGEEVNLDDSSWAAIAPGEKAPNDAVWFRQTVEIPATLKGYDLSGARVWFQIHVHANGPLPEIVYFNGRRVAMGEDLEPIVLFDKAKPGDKAVIAVKLLHTVDTKGFRGATMRVDFAEGRPNPGDLRVEFLSAALLVPSLAPGDASKTAILNDAIAAVDLAALDAPNHSDAQAKFDASLKSAQSKLQALKPLLEQATFHLTGNSHIDAAWLWPWTETVDVVKRTFGTALQLMYEYPQYTYTQSAAAYNQWIADKYPDMNAEIAQRIKEGRWEIVGGMWVEPDLNMPDGESLVRQFLVGKRWYKQAYGVDVRIGWNPDSFGYTWQLPQIMKKSGVDYFVTQKMAWNDTNQLPFKFFWWESPDGSKVLTYFPHDYANNDLNPVRLARDFTIAQKQATGLPGILDLYGVGDHGGGPTRAILDEGFHWAGQDSKGGGHVTPKIEFGSAQSYFTDLEKKIAPDSPEWNYASIAKGYTAPPPVAGKVNIPTWKAELYFEYHRGVMTTQANHKKGMREAEEQVLNAEKWASLAWVLAGRAYPSVDLTEDWKKVLFNQFHDTAAGSGIGVIYKDAAKDYDVVRWSTNEIDAAALGAVAEKIDTTGVGKDPNGQSIVVFNPLGWARGGEVTVKVKPLEKTGRVASVLTGDGKVVVARVLSRDQESGIADIEIPIHEDARFGYRNIPAFGYEVFRIPSEKDGVGAGEGGNGAKSVGSIKEYSNHPGPDDTLSIRARNISITVNALTGCIVSLKDVRSDLETIAPGGCGNELQAFKDTPKNYDAWNIDPGTLDQPPTRITAADAVEWVDGPKGRGDIRISRHWQNSKFVQTIHLDDTSEFVDIDNDIDWHESHVLLKAAFPLAATSNFATYEIAYGAIDRPTTRNNSWEQAQFEVPAMRWADLGDGKHGLSLLNQTKYGYDAVGNTLRLTLLRSPKWPDPEADMGHHHFHYALYPHAGTWKDALTVRHGYEYNYPLTAVVTTAHAGSLPASHSFASVTPDNVVLTAVKKAEDANSLIFRVYEWAGKSATAEFHVPAGATSATVTNLMETPEGATLPVADGVVKVPIHPYEILTIRVDYPAAAPKQ